MKPAQIRQLAKAIDGEVSSAADALDACSTDASVVTLRPSAVLYPRNSRDIQAAVAFASQESKKSNKQFTITARGLGTDLSGAAIGEGAVMVMPAHLNRIKRLTKDTVTVQPGISFGALQQILHTHGRCLPAYPASLHYSTIGGAVANNAGGEGSVKHGTITRWVKSLRVVLDDGSEIEAKRISKRELNRKKGLMTREGDLYRGIDGLLQDHASVIKDAHRDVARNTSGYQLEGMKRRDGSIDLGRLFIGAQGTLGIITEITLRTAPYTPQTTLVVAGFSSVEAACEAALQIGRLQPSAIEFADRYFLECIRERQPQLVAGLLPEGLPTAVLWIEFDDSSHVRQVMASRRAARIIGRTATFQHSVTQRIEQERWWAIRRMAFMGKTGAKKTLPALGGACVPVQHLAEYIESAQKILKKYKLESPIWGHAGEGVLYLQPAMDLGKAKERKRLLDLTDELSAMVIRMGGAVSGAHGDGMVWASYLEQQYGKEYYELLTQVKEICDPCNMFNPRVKFGVSNKDLESALRHDYSLARWHSYAPRT